MYYLCVLPHRDKEILSQEPYFQGRIRSIVSDSNIPSPEHIAFDIAACYQTGDIILIYDHLDGNGIEYGFGYELASTIRVLPYFTKDQDQAKEQLTNTIKNAPIIILSLFSFQDIIRQNPMFCFFCAPGIHYKEYGEWLDLLANDCAKLDELTQTLGPISEKEYRASFTYIIPKKSIEKRNKRHRLAAAYAIKIFESFVHFVQTAHHRDYFQESTAAYSPLMNRDIELQLFGLDQSFESINDLIGKDAPAIHQTMDRIRENALGGIGVIDDDPAWTAIFNMISPSEKPIFDDVLSGCLHKSRRNISASDFATITDYVAQQNYCCLLLDVRLNPNLEERESGIENKLGAKLLQYIRARLPSLPILIITVTNKLWKHRKLLSRKADAVWVKEGPDEGRSSLQSYYNIIRFIGLLDRLTGDEYQFFARLSELIHRIKTNPASFWWFQQPLRWQWTREEKLRQIKPEDDSFDFVLELCALLSDIENELRNYLVESILNFDEARNSLAKGDTSQPSTTQQHTVADTIAKNIVILGGKIVEMFHGARLMDEEQSSRNRHQSVRVNSRTIQSRNDYLAYWILLSRHECAHYFSNIKYEFLDNSQSPKSRSLIKYLSTLLAYVGCQSQPYHRYDKKLHNALRSSEKTRKVNPDFVLTLFDLKSAHTEVKEYQTAYYHLLGNGKEGRY